MTRSFALTASSGALGEHRALVQDGHLHAEVAHERPCRARPPRPSGARRSRAGGSAVSAVSWSVMPAAGSSTRRSFGSCASSMPISSHCFWPWRELAGLRRAMVREADALEDARRSAPAARAVRRANRVGQARAVRLEGEERGCPRRVCMSNTVGFWNLRPMPSSAISASSRRGEVVRRRRTAPRRRSGRVLPVMTSIMVVLPAPFGPMMARISAGSTVSERRVQRPEAVEARR